VGTLPGAVRPLGLVRRMRVKRLIGWAVIIAAPVILGHQCAAHFERRGYARGYAHGQADTVGHAVDQAASAWRAALDSAGALGVWMDEPRRTVFYSVEICEPVGDDLP